MSLNTSVVVRRICQEAEDICSYELAAADGGSLPPYTAGSHIDVLTPGGAIRQYSLCAEDPQQGRYRIAVLHERNGRGGSSAMHTLLKEGDVLSVSTPRNLFALAADPAPSLLLAGGIGITPILAMGLELIRSKRDFQLHYFTRSETRTAFREVLSSEGFAGRAHVHHDDRVTERFDVQRAISDAPRDARIYVCGPRGFIDAALDAARKLGWPEERLHQEYFTAKEVAAGPVEIFEVVIASSGKVITVHPHQSVVAALSEEGVEIPTSCEQGVCGTCLTDIKEGVPDHRDSFLTAAEQASCKQFTPCCSRSLSPRLVLDI